MDNITSKYNYLNNYLKQIWNYHVHKDHLENHPDKNNVNNLLCLSNQFYYIIKLPNINNTYFSPNTTNILGIHNHSLTIKHFLERIHPKDHEKIIEKYIKIFDHIKKKL